MIANKEAVLGQPARTIVRARGLQRDKILSWLGFASVIVLSATLNMWNLAQNGYSNTYYSVAVKSMLQSWKNFFFASYDAGGFITVDKPPVALWVQAISAKIFGFSSLSLLLPEALAGVASVALVYYLVRRAFGSLAGFVAALAMAITPIAVAVERGNNTDTLLVFTLLLAAWAILRATEKGRLAILILSMALVGVAFNIKMLAAFIVLPAFYLLYLLAAPLKWYKRLVHLGLASVVLLVVSFSWATAVQLTPAADRPWIGGSQTNSVFDLAFNYNGLGRVTGNEGNGTPGSGQAPQGAFQSGSQGDFQPPSAPQGSSSIQTPPGGSSGFPSGMQPPSGNPGGATGASGMFGAGVAGPFRLFGSELASQWSWLLPLAGFGVLAVALGLKRRFLADRKGQSVLLWAGWLATYGVVFSMAEGIFHVYYLIMLAPGVAALVGIGLASLWKAYRNGGWQAWLLPAALAATAAWQVKVLADYNYPQWGHWLVPATLAGATLSAVALLVPLLASKLFKRVLWRRVAPGLVAVGLLALVASPLAWSVTPVLAAGNGIMPTSGPKDSNGGFGQGAGRAGQNGPEGELANSGLISYLEANQGEYFYLVAVSSANQASQIVLQTGKPVLAMGGFTGSDPAMTVEKLKEMIASKQVRFILLGGGGPDGGSSAVSQWVQQNFKEVDSSLYSGSTSTTSGGFGGMGFMGGNSQLYDLTQPASAQ